MLEMTNKPLNARLQRLAEQVYKREKTLPVLKKGSSEWWAWYGWRKRRGLSVALMDERPTWTVPTEMPPEDIDAALAESGPASKRLAR